MLRCLGENGVVVPELGSPAALPCLYRQSCACSWHRLTLDVCSAAGGDVLGSSEQVLVIAVQPISRRVIKPLIHVDSARMDFRRKIGVGVLPLEPCCDVRLETSQKTHWARKPCDPRCDLRAHRSKRNGSERPVRRFGLGILIPDLVFCLAAARPV